MKKIVFLSIIMMSLSSVSFAGQAKKKTECTATGVPRLSCVCFPDGECIDLGDIGTHP
jgi:hypothetical protein